MIDGDGQYDFSQRGSLILYHFFFLSKQCIVHQRWAARLQVCIEAPGNWPMVTEEVVDLGAALNASFYQVKRDANTEADHLAIEGIARQSLMIEKPVVFSTLL